MEPLKVTSGEAFYKIAEADDLGQKIPPELDITCVEIPHVYTLGWYEATRNHTRYYDKPGETTNYLRTPTDKIFNIFHGKTAELEFQRQANNHGYTTIKGTSLFAGKPDDGIDHKYDKLGNVQIKYRHGWKRD